MLTLSGTGVTDFIYNMRKGILSVVLLAVLACGDAEQPRRTSANELQRTSNKADKLVITVSPLVVTINGDTTRANYFIIRVLWDSTQRKYVPVLYDVGL